MNKIITKYYEEIEILLINWIAPHYKDLQNYPHHLHKNNIIESINFIPNIKFVIKRLEESILSQ